MNSLAKHYQDALAVQNACNLSEVVFSFVKAMQALCDLNLSTDARNNHAICRLFAEQIKHLTLGRSYDSAYDECEKNS